MTSSLLLKIKIYLCAYIGAALLYLLNATLRWKPLGLAETELLRGERPLIIVFWHSRQLHMPWAYLRSRQRGGRQRVYALISQHRDGRIVAEGMRCIGIHSVAGSSSRNGSRALQELSARLKEGYHVAITPDGPRGPCRRAKMGAIALAMRSGAPIIPCAFSASRAWRLDSWDRMMVPKPFSHALYVFGKPLFLPPDLTEHEQERCRATLEKMLDAVTAEADELAAAEAVPTGAPLKA